MITSYLYRYYKNKVYKRIKNIRGATRLRKILFQLSHLGLEKYEGKPTSIFERGEWDNLIILDACRYDTYQEVFNESEKRISLGSHSVEFLQKTFTQDSYDDIVYINGNVHFTDFKMEEHIGRTGIFHEKFETIMNKWDEEEGTVMPEEITQDALTAGKLFPDKKRIIHFIQPHRPFVKNPIEKEIDVYGMAEIGKIEDNKVKEAYRKNLEILKEHVEKLEQELEGKTVVTADHGELMGENSMYDHFRKSDAKGLREVPWDVRGRDQ